MRYQVRTGVLVPFVQKYYKLLILAVASLFTLSYMVMTLAAGAAPGKRNAAADAEKVPICHYDEDMGTYKLISISGNAVDKHIENHGDGMPGQYVMGDSGDWFDDSCNVVSRYGEITAPLAGEKFEIGQTVTLSAFLVDKDKDDSVS